MVRTSTYQGYGTFPNLLYRVRARGKLVWEICGAPGRDNRDVTRGTGGGGGRGSKKSPWQCIRVHAEPEGHLAISHNRRPGAACTLNSTSESCGGAPGAPWGLLGGRDRQQGKSRVVGLHSPRLLRASAAPPRACGPCGMACLGPRGARPTDLQRWRWLRRPRARAAAADDAGGVHAWRCAGWPTGGLRGWPPPCRQLTRRRPPPSPSARRGVASCWTGARPCWTWARSRELISLRGGWA